MATQNTAQDILDQMMSSLPQIKTNRNGYEIRTQILELANQAVWNDYHARWGQYEWSVEKKDDRGTIVVKAEHPDVPGVSDVLEAAEKFYNFVNRK